MRNNVTSMDKGEQPIKVQMILKPDEILGIEGARNELVGQSSENPFMLSSFALQITKAICSEDNAPLIPVFFPQEKDYWNCAFHD